jgi:hypothetical protein
MVEIAVDLTQPCSIYCRNGVHGSLVYSEIGAHPEAIIAATRRVLWEPFSASRAEAMPSPDFPTKPEAWLVLWREPLQAT